MHYSFYDLRATRRIEDEFDPHLHCNIGISFGGGKKKSKFSESTNQSSSKEQDATTSTTEKTSGSSTGTQTGSKTSTSTSKVGKSGTVTADDVSSQEVVTKENIRALDQETQDILSDLVKNAGGDLDEIIGSLSSSALTAESDLAGLIDPIIANARTNLNERVGASQQALARSAGGSSQNTLVQQLGLRESARAEGELADLAARLGLQTRQTATGEKTAAADAAGGLVAQLSNILKGADTTRTGTQESDTIRALTEITDEQSTQELSTSELSELLSSTATEELASSVSESTMKEIASLIGKTTGRGKGSSASLGASFSL